MIDIKYNLDDFGILYWCAMGNFSHEQPHRFEARNKHTSRAYKDGEGFLYWVGHDAGVSDGLLAFKILQAEGHEPNLMWDMAEQNDGSLWGHCVLTTYQHDKRLEPWSKK